MAVFQIEALNRKHTVVLPGFTEREELVVAWSETQGRGGVRFLRACSAVIGLCTRLGKEAGAEYGKHAYDPLAYGGAVYQWLRLQGVTPSDIVRLASPILLHLHENLFPRQAEVDEELGKSEASGEKQTA